MVAKYGGGVIKYPNKANKLNIEDKYQKMKFEKNTPELL